jgi:hypothetical protein
VLVRLGSALRTPTTRPRCASVHMLLSSARRRATHVTVILPTSRALARTTTSTPRQYLV